MDEVSSGLAGLNLHDRYNKADQYRGDIYAANPDFGGLATSATDSHTQGVYGTAHLGDLRTTPAQVNDYKAAIYAANPATFEQKSAIDAQAQAVYGTAHLGDLRTTPAHVNDYRSAVYAANPAAFEQKSATDAHAQAVYATAHLGDLRTTPAHVNDYRSAVYAANPAAFEQKSATDAHAQAVYATAHLGDLNVRPADVNPYKAAIYQANPETFNGKAATDKYASDVYAASHVGDMVAEDAGELTARSKINAHAQAVYQSADLAPAPKSSGHAYTQGVYATAHLGDVRMHPATVVNAYKAAIYQANPDTFSTKATTHAYAGDVYAASHLGDLAVVDNGELTARSKVNAHTQAVYGAMAGDAMRMEMTRPAINTHRLGVYTAAQQDIAAQIPAERPRVSNSYRTAVYHTAKADMMNAAKYDIDEELAETRSMPITPSSLKSDSVTSLAKFAAQMRHKGSVGARQAPPLASLSKTNLSMSVENLASLISNAGITQDMHRSSSAQSLVDLANQKAAMERSAMIESPVRGRLQRVGHIGMMANLQKFAS